MPADAITHGLAVIGFGKMLRGIVVLLTIALFIGYVLGRRGRGFRFLIL